MPEMSQEQIRERVAALGPWFHNISLDGVISCGGRAKKNRRPLEKLVFNRLRQDFVAVFFSDLEFESGADPDIPA